MEGWCHFAGIMGVRHCVAMEVLGVSGGNGYGKN